MTDNEDFYEDELDFDDDPDFDDDSDSVDEQEIIKFKKKTKINMAKRLAEFKKEFGEYLQERYTDDKAEKPDTPEILFSKLVQNGFILDANNQPYKPNTTMDDIFKDIVSKSKKAENGELQCDHAFSLYENSTYNKIRLDFNNSRLLKETGSLQSAADMSQASVQMYGQIKRIYNSINKSLKSSREIFSTESPEFEELTKQLDLVNNALVSGNPTGLRPDGTSDPESQMDYTGLSNVLNSLQDAVNEYKHANTGEPESKRQMRLESLCSLETLMRQVKDAADIEQNNGVGYCSRNYKGKVNIWDNVPLELYDLFLDNVASKTLLHIAYMNKQGEGLKNPESKTPEEIEYANTVYNQLVADPELLTRVMNNSRNGFKQNLVSFVDELVGSGDVDKLLSLNIGKLAKYYADSRFYNPGVMFGDVKSTTIDGLNFEIKPDNTLKNDTDNVPETKSEDVYREKLAGQVLKALSYDILYAGGVERYGKNIETIKIDTRTNREYPSDNWDELTPDEQTRLTNSGRVKDTKFVVFDKKRIELDKFRAGLRTNTTNLYNRLQESLNEDELNKVAMLDEGLVNAVDEYIKQYDTAEQAYMKLTQDHKGAARSREQIAGLFMESVKNQTEMMNKVAKLMSRKELQYKPLMPGMKLNLKVEKLSPEEIKKGLYGDVQGLYSAEESYEKLKDYAPEMQIPMTQKMREKELTEKMQSVVSGNKRNYAMVVDTIRKESVSLLDEFNRNESFHHSKQYKALNTIVCSLSADIAKGSHKVDNLEEKLAAAAEAAEKYKKHHSKRGALESNVRNRLKAANRIILLYEKVRECARNDYDSASVQDLYTDYGAAKVLDHSMWKACRAAYNNRLDYGLNIKEYDEKIQKREECVDGILTGDYIRALENIKAKDKAFERTVKSAKSSKDKIRDLAFGKNTFLKEYVKQEKAIAAEKKEAMNKEKAAEKLNTAFIK